jgi:hypothetical protein
MNTTMRLKAWHLAGVMAVGAMLGGIGVASAMFYIAALTG